MFHAFPDQDPSVRNQIISFSRCYRGRWSILIHLTRVPLRSTRGYSHITPAGYDLHRFHILVRNSKIHLFYAPISNFLHFPKLSSVVLIEPSHLPIFPGHFVPQSFRHPSRPSRPSRPLSPSLSSVVPDHIPKSPRDGSVKSGWWP